MGSISSRFTVAIHILTMLAQAKGPLTSAYMAGSINTNPVVVRRIMLSLRHAGLVRGQPGAKGGVVLSVPAKKLTLRRVYEAVEKAALFSLHAKKPNPRCPIGCNIQETLNRVFTDADRAMKKVLSVTTLEKILKDTIRQ